MPVDPQPSALSNPEIPRAGEGSRRKVGFILLLAALLACFVWIMVTRLLTADEPLERDICTQILMGRVLVDGGKMYVDTVEFKPPGMFVIWQIIHELIGTGPNAVLWVNVFVTMVTLLGVFWAASAKPWGRGAGIWAMSFWTVICGDMMLQANQPSNEVFMNAFMTWGIALWMRADSARSGARQYAAAGLLLGIVTLIKPVLLTVACMVLAWTLAEGMRPPALKRRARIMGWLLLPIVVGWGLMIAYFAGQGRGGDLYDCLVRYGTYYAKSNAGQTEGSNLGLLTNILQGLGIDLLFPPYLRFTFPLVVLTYLGIGGGWRSGQRSQAVTLAACLVGSFFAVAGPGTFFAHYYQLYLPVLAIGAGWGIATVTTSLRRPQLARGLGVVTLLLLAWHVVPNHRYDGKAWSHFKYSKPADDFVEVERCGRAVKQMLTPDESCYVWGNDPGVYYYSDRHPASGIFWADRLISGPTQTRCTRKVMEDLHRTRPPLILVEDGWEFENIAPDHPVSHLLREDYQLVPEARFSRLFTVYIRRHSDLAVRVQNRKQLFSGPLSGDAPDLLNKSAHDYLQIGRPDEAFQRLERALQLHPDHVATHTDLGNMLAAQGQSDAAIQHYQRALRLDPDYIQAHYYLACELAARKRWAEAIPHFERAIQLKPVMAEAQQHLGLALAAQGQRAAAAAHFNKALELATAQGDAALMEAARAQLKLTQPAPPPARSP